MYVQCGSDWGVGVGVRTTLVPKWSVMITDHFETNKKIFENFGELYGPQGGGQNHIGSKIVSDDH